MESPGYHANSEPLTFDQAVIYCRRLNMHLPVPLNEESNADLHSEIRKEIFLGIRSVCALGKNFISEPSILVKLRYLANTSMWTMEKISFIRTGKKKQIQLWDLGYWSNMTLRNWIVSGSLLKFLNGWTDCLWCLITICDSLPSFIPTLKWRSNISNLIATRDTVFWLQMESGELNATEIESFGLFVFLDFYRIK